MIDFTKRLHLRNELVSAYGCEPAPLVLTENYSKKTPTEYMLQYASRKRRVYNWVEPSGNSKMYVMWHGAEAFVTPEVEAMLTQGNPGYVHMTPIAATVSVLS